MWVFSGNWYNSEIVKDVSANMHENDSSEMIIDCIFIFKVDIFYFR